MPVKMIWNPLMPTKVGFFVGGGGGGGVWWGMILTMDQLKKGGFTFSNRRPFCGKTEEGLGIFLSTALRFEAFGLPCFLYQKADGFVPTWLKS